MVMKLTQEESRIAVRSVHKAPEPHWVGDGLLVQGMFSAHEMGNAISPFLLLDYNAPLSVTAGEPRRGVGEHPHRGFETVTIAYQGEIEHRDSAGNHGVIGPGDVQWMTAASGIVHEEMYSQRFAEQGGVLEFIQLWVNLPASAKMSKPGYQTLLNNNIPLVTLPGDAGSLRVVAGEYDGVQGAATTFSAVHLWDVRLNRGAKCTLDFPLGFTVAVFVRDGEVVLQDNNPVYAREIAFLERSGGTLDVEAHQETGLLIMAGQPLDEPIVAYGPFVMNTQEEIHQAFRDYRSGRMGHLE